MTVFADEMSEILKTFELAQTRAFVNSCANETQSRPAGSPSYAHPHAGVQAQPQNGHRKRRPNGAKYDYSMVC